MASEVDICNLALSLLGDPATVASLAPPEGSAQAEYCSTFYPVARDALFELHDWGFATRSMQPARLSENRLGGQYAYARPSNLIRIIWLREKTLCMDESATPLSFVAESDEEGNNIILTDAVDPVLKYTYLVTDPNRFTTLFKMALSWHLASMLAGPILKGEAGAAQGRRCQEMMHAYLSQARVSDANQKRVNPQYLSPWIRARG